MTIGDWALAWLVLALLVLAALIACNPATKPDVHITPPTHGAGTLAGRTPIIGYRLICTDGNTTWQVDSVVIHPNWPPSETCY